ncbi:DUF192 domain-containing protein [Candidatus Gracilibacteria bacterium]|nr:DUF192 domain-containing protein [Candidatus Gracilibacteria bacterium]
MTKEQIFTDIKIPRGFFQKAKGLLGVKTLDEKSGMLFKNCNNIHMFGMKIPLDIVFLKSDGQILKCVKNLKPWRAAICLKATMTLELPSGSIEKNQLTTLNKLEIMDEN